MRESSTWERYVDSIALRFTTRTETKDFISLFCFTTQTFVPIKVKYTQRVSVMARMVSRNKQPGAFSYTNRQ